MSALAEPTTTMGAGGALAAAAAAQREAGARFEENGRWSGLGLEPEKKAVAGGRDRAVPTKMEALYKCLEWGLLT